LKVVFRLGVESTARSQQRQRLQLETYAQHQREAAAWSCLDYEYNKVAARWRKAAEALQKTAPDPWCSATTGTTTTTTATTVSTCRIYSNDIVVTYAPANNSTPTASWNDPDTVVLHW
jgi:type II secretory pathway pseudopilin PulG